MAEHLCDERGTFERVSTSETEESDDENGDLDDSKAGQWLTDFDGVGASKADALEDAGYASRDRIDQATTDDLAAVDGISEDLAVSIKDQLNAEMEENNA